MQNIALIASGTLQTPSVSWTGLLPLIILAAAAVFLLTICSLVPSRITNQQLTIYTCAAAIGSLIAAIPLWLRVLDESKGPFSTLSGAFGIDGFSIFLTMLLAVSVVLVSCLAGVFLKAEDIEGPESYVLLLLSATGGMIIVGANDFIVLFLGIEVLSISAYVLAAMNLKRVQSQEAGLKYFVLGAFASGFLLYGIALLYGATGSTQLTAIRDFLINNNLTNDTLLLAALAFSSLVLHLKSQLYLSISGRQMYTKVRRHHLWLSWHQLSKPQDLRPC